MRIILLGHMQEEKLLGDSFIWAKLCQNALWVVLMSLLSVSTVSFIFRSIIYLIRNIHIQILNLLP